MERSTDSEMMYPKSIDNLLHRIITGLICLLHAVLLELTSLSLPSSESTRSIENIRRSGAMSLSLAFKIDAIAASSEIALWVGVS